MGSVIAEFPPWVYWLEMAALILAMPVGWFSHWLQERWHRRRGDWEW